MLKCFWNCLREVTLIWVVFLLVAARGFPEVDAGKGFRVFGFSGVAEGGLVLFAARGVFLCRCGCLEVLGQF